MQLRMQEMGPNGNTSSTSEKMYREIAASDVR